MSDLTNYLHIPYLIVKDLHGELSDEERLTLEQWLDEREDNKLLFEKIRNQRDTQQRIQLVKKLHKNSAWKRVDRATGGKRSWITYCIRYAAVVVFVISSIFFVMYLLPEKSSQMPLHSEVRINPGSIKAELILADGQHLPLDGKEENSILSDQDGVTIIKGNAGIRYESKDSDGKLAYHELRIPRGGEFSLVLEDGTEVYINSETKFRYPVKFEESERRVFLVGEAYFKVKRDENRPFRVEMEGNRIEVLGTEFNARYYLDEDKQMTTLVSGKVKFISGKDKSLELFPGEQAILTSKGELVRKSVDVNLYTAWKDGNFVFRKQRLEEVLNTLARWYDVEVFYEDVSRKDVVFTGNMKRFEHFEEIMDLLRMTGDTDFEIKGKNIFVRRK